MIGSSVCRLTAASIRLPRCASDLRLFVPVTLIRLTTTRSCVQLFKIQAVENGADGPQFLPDLSRPTRHLAAVEGE